MGIGSLDVPFNVCLPTSLLGVAYNINHTLTVCFIKGQSQLEVSLPAAFLNACGTVGLTTQLKARSYSCTFISVSSGVWGGGRVAGYLLNWLCQLRKYLCNHIPN